MRKAGIIELGNEVDITDPCYDKTVWCRTTQKCVPGEYHGYINTKNCGVWGERVSSICIYKDNKRVPLKDMEIIADIGVDAGLAGFFNNKPDFNDEEWNDLCNQISKGDSWNLYNGVFAHSGYGDGSYPVYANKERTAFAIKFI